MLTSLARGQAARGYQVTVLAILDEDVDPDPFVARFAGSDVRVHAERMPGRAYLRERRTVASLIVGMGPDVVHTHGFRPDVVDAPIARRHGVPAVSTVHGFTRRTARIVLYERLQRRALRRFDGVVAVSQSQRDELLAAGVPRDRLHLVRNAWVPVSPPLPRDEARRELRLRPSGPIVGWVGRLSPEKGPDVFLRALARSELAGLEASIIGSGPEEASLRVLAQDLGVDDRVRWHGMIPQAGRLLRAFDVYALSSRTEGIPIGLLEAMAAGVPIVATSVGGVPEVVGPEEARLVPPDDPPALARAVNEALRDERRSARMVAAAGVSLSQRLSEGPWLDAYALVYEAVLTAKARE